MWDPSGVRIFIHVVLKLEKLAGKTRTRIAIIIKDGIFDLRIVYAGGEQT
jgi:hypothetical protein